MKRLLPAALPGVVGLIVAGALALIVVTVPLALSAQWIFALVTIAGATLLARSPSKKATLVLAMLSLIVSTRYIFWRTTATLAALPLVYSDAQGPRDDRTFFLLNRVDDRLRLGRDIATMLGGLLGNRLFGTIRRDEAVGEALAMMETLASFAPASAALADLRAIADRLVADRDDTAQPQRGIA